MDQQFDPEQSFGNQPLSATDVHYRTFRNHQAIIKDHFYNQRQIFHAVSLDEHQHNHNNFRQSGFRSNINSGNQFAVLQQNRKLAIILLTIKMDTIVAILQEKALNKQMHGFLKIKNYQTAIQTNCLDLQYCIQNVSLFAQKIDKVIYNLKLKYMSKCWLYLLKSGNTAKMSETIPNLSSYTTVTVNQNDQMMINQIVCQSPNQISKRKQKQKKRITSRYSQSRGIRSPNGMGSKHVSPNLKQKNYINLKQNQNLQIKKQNSTKDKYIEEQQVRKENRLLKNKKSKMRNNVSEFYQQMDELLSIHQLHLKK